MQADPLLWQFVLQIVLILCNAVFACAEIAVLSVNDARLSVLATGGDRRALRLCRMTSQPARFLATIQVAITLSGFLGSAFAASNFSTIIVDALIKLGAPENFKITVKNVKVSAGAGFIVVLTGDILTMPGLPKKPAAENIDVDENGRITGLF